MEGVVMKNHIQILGVLYILFGLLGVVVAVIFFDALAGRGPIPGKMKLIFSTSGFGSVLALFFVLVSLPGIIGGLALLMRKSWARIWVLILGFVNIFNIPLGTMLGIYTIWVLMSEEATNALDSGAESEPMPRVFPPYH
jgi:hypothetical protein